MIPYAMIVNCSDGELSKVPERKKKVIFAFCVSYNQTRDISFVSLSQHILGEHWLEKNDKRRYTGMFGT